MKRIFLLIAFISFLLLWGCKTGEKYEENWFVFSPEKDYENSEIMMNDWQDAPAGRHGFVRMDGGVFSFEDGTPVKFWGVNIASSKPYVENEVADEWTEYLTHFGVNAVRFHKFTSHAMKSEVSTELDAGMLDRMDYFHARLKENGIYIGWSHIYGHKPKPGDRGRLIAYDEIAGIEVPWSHLNSATSGLVNFARDLQDLNIALTVNLLNHVNPYTGLKYAEDPALNFIELQNEDNIFWGAIEASLEQTPTYKNLLSKQFSEWLKKKYGTQEALEKAWGKENIPEGQQLDKLNLYPQPNHSAFSEEYNLALKEGRTIRQHFLDKGRFLYEKQIEFYDRFVEAIRETGYKGPIVGSCWQAGSGLLHLYNLYTDYKTGFIDRHNYFGGGTGHRLDTGTVRNESMVSNPGSGLLSTGLQMVSNRPFAFSEWISKLPNPWIAEAPVIIAAYGMGLQGWDASYHFASNTTFYTSTIESDNHGVYNVESPLQLTLYPALARMVLRNDITESSPLIIRRVSLEGLLKGNLGAVEKVVQDYDNKSISGEVPQETLAIGKVALEFTGHPRENEIPDLTEYWDPLAKKITSITGELHWDYSDRGYFTINSPGTQGVTGFAGNQPVELNEFSVEMENPFGIILFTSLDKGADLSESNKILITTLAKGKNSGMEYNEDYSKLLKTGGSPVMLEGVVAGIEIKNDREPVSVTVLDHIGRKTDQKVEVRNNRLRIDGGKYETLYYLIEY